MSIKLKDTIYDLISNSDKLDGKDSSNFATSSHTHNLGNKNAEDLSSTYPSGISIGGIYQGNYPFNYGSTITAAGNGGYFQIAGQWNEKVTGLDNYDFPTEMYIRGRRDSYDVWTTWSRVLTNRNYTNFAAKKDHTHNYSSTIKIGSTSYACSSNTISLPDYPTLSSLGAASSSHTHSYLPLSGGTLTNSINFQTGTQTAIINARYDGTNYSNILWHKHGDSSGSGSIVIFGSPLWENVILETKANQNCAYRQTSGTKYKIWDSGNDGSDSGLDADLLDGVHLMGKGGTEGIMRSWARGTYTTSKQYFGNGNVVVIDPTPTDDSSLWDNTTIFSVGDLEIRSHQLAFAYNEDKILYRRVHDGPRYNSWRTIAFIDSKVSSSGYADNSGQLGGYGTGTFYMAARGSLNKDTLGTFTQRASGGYKINGYSGYSGLLISLQGNGGSCSSIEFIASHYDISVGGLQVRYTIDSSWYGTTKSIAFTDSNVASASKLATARTISLTGSITGSGSFDGSGNLSISTTTNHSHSYLPLSGGTMTGNITVFTGDNGRGLKFGSGTLNSLSNQLLWQSSEAIRFGSSSWDWNQWAGLKYNSSSKIIYLGIPDNVIFNANSAQSGGSIYTPGVSSIYIGNGTYAVWHSGNFAPGNYMPKSGGTFTGSVTFANGTWNVVGDDAAIGDYNAAGMLGLKSCNNNIPGIGFHNSSGTLLGSLTCDSGTLKWGGTAISLNGHTHSYVSTNIASSLTNTATVNYASTPYGVNYRNHYSGHGLGSYRGVLTCKDNSVGFELNSYWCVNPADGVGTNNLYYRVKRDSASDWGPYARIIDSGNIGSQSVSYASSAGNADTTDGYHISVVTSLPSSPNSNTIYYIT